MPKYSNRDHYLDATTGVLINRLGLMTEAALEENEAALVAARAFELAQNPLRGAFNFPHLKAIHRHLFGDIYAWAGECRTVDIHRGGTFFAHHSHIEKAAQPLFSRLKKEECLAGLNPEIFSKRAAHYLGEINALHPFREGNGRAQREFISHLAYHNGYHIGWKNISQKDMIQASIESFQGDCSRFAAYISQNLQNLA